MPELVPIRYGRMLVSPFTFFRGAAAIMAADLASTPDTGITVQCCGDAHLSNFGVFGSPERQMIFDINDFDETLPGPWEWDLKRLAASFEVAGRDLGFSPADRRSIVVAVSREYRRRLRQASQGGALEVWYSHMEVSQMVEWIRTEVGEKRMGKKDGHEAVLDAAKARTRDSLRAFKRLTGEVDGKLRFVEDPPLIVPIEGLVLTEADRERTERSFRKLIKAYRRTLAGEHHPLEEYRYVHMARKVVGVGECGHPGVDLPHARGRPARPADPAGEGGPTLGHGALRRKERLREPRAAGGRGSAAHADRQ